MRADASFAVPVKLWALLCVFAGVTIGGNVLLTCILTGGALLYLVLQRSFRLAASYGCFYLLLALLLYGIRFHGLRMPVFSEFYVLMFWNLSPIFLVSWDLITTPPGMLSAFLSRLRMPTPFILGLLVVFRFFPTMRTELKGVGRSMKNRGLTAAGQLLVHPVQSIEYVDDMTSTGYTDFPKYPLETLYDQCGDCEDSSILLGALLKELGYGCIFIELPEHVAIGVKATDDAPGTYYDYNGSHYLYIETTNSGWDIGTLPDDFNEEKAKIYDVW